MRCLVNSEKNIAQCGENYKRLSERLLDDTGKTESNQGDDYIGHGSEFSVEFIQVLDDTR